MTRARKCTGPCGLTKVLACFDTYRQRTGRGHKGPWSEAVYYRSRCRLCAQEAKNDSARRRYQISKTRRLQVNDAWRRRNMDKIRVLHREYKRRMTAARQEELGR